MGLTTLPYAQEYTPSGGFLPAYTLPLTALSYDKPDEEISEYEKHKDDGEWFKLMARWIVCNFFNPPVQRFYNNDNNSLRLYEDQLENFAYYFGRQQNKTFGYTETINENDTIQAVYVPDQKIRQIVDSMIGTALKIINPIEDSLSATVLSKDAIKGKEELKRKLEIKKQLNDLLQQAQGVKFAPGGIEEIGEDENIDDIVNDFKDEQAVNLIRMAQGLYYANKLKIKLEQSTLHEIVNNCSSFLVDVVNGKTEFVFFPSYNSIVDWRATDDFLTDAMLSGGVQFLTPSEIFSKWDFTDEEKAHIINMSQKKYANWNECYAFYNTGGGNNITWFDQYNGKVACATTYWIGKKDLPYRTKETKFGKKKVQVLDYNKEYAVTDEKGNPKTENGKHVTQKGSEIRTDKGTWFVHTCTIVGNCYAKGYGYHAIQVRPQGRKQRPLLPTVQFVHRLTMGYARSVVSRLRPYSDEKGRLKLKIQELTGRDMGKVYVLFASKLGLNEDQAKEMFKDFKTMGVTLINDTGEAGDKLRGLTADMLDFSLQPSIMSYVELCREQDREMEAVGATSIYALGQQTTNVGKGVQDTTIAQSTLGQLSLYEGLTEHWRQLLQYGLNVQKTLDAGKEVVVQTSSNRAYLVNINKDLKWEDIGLYIEINDEFEQQEKKVLMDGMFAYAQNGGNLDSAEALYNLVKIIRGKSAREQEEYLEQFIAKKKKESMAMMQQQQAGQMQHEASMQTANQEFLAQMEAMKQIHADYRTETTAVLAAVSKLQADMQQNAMQMMAAVSQQAPVSPMEQQLAQAQQAQQEQAAQQQGQQPPMQ